MQTGIDHGKVLAAMCEGDDVQLLATLFLLFLLFLLRTLWKIDPGISTFAIIDNEASSLVVQGPYASIRPLKNIVLELVGKVVFAAGHRSIPP